MPNRSLTYKEALTDITVALGAITTIGEGILAATPSGPVHTGLAIALPILLAVAAAVRKLAG